MKRAALVLWFACLLLVCTCAFGEEVVLQDETGIFVEEVTTESRELSLNDEGDDVRSLQQRLTSLGYYTGELSGRFGEATKAALEAFQADFGLPVSGEADAQTQAVLYSALYRPLRYGSTGDDVKRLQTRLTELGYYTGKISGNFLAATQSAVEALQEKNGLPVTGEADVDALYLIYGGDVLGKNDRAADPAATPTPAPPTDGFLVDDNEHAVDPDPAIAAATPVAFTKQLARGSKGAQVKTLQNRLTDLGYYTGPISGNFMVNTFRAVKAFQEQNGLKVDGIVGEETWTAIFSNDPVLPEDTPRPTATPTPIPFAITVDVANQVTTVYGRDENGEYTVVVRQMLCSTGTRAAPSDVGDWVLSGRTARWAYFPKWGGYAQWWTKINGSIAFHSVIYNTVSTMDLSVKSYNKLGKRASHGCIRLTVADAKWIYDNCGKGTVVTITEKLPADPELVASLKLPPLNYKNMLPQTTPEPTPEPVYVSGGLPPLPLKKLEKGDSSESVYWLQRKLAELGYYTGKCSGTFLGGTQNAVKAFQKDHGLRANGVATVETQEALYAAELATPTPEATSSPTPTAEVIPSPEAE